MNGVRFIEMFCGIGGFRLGLERANMVGKGNGEERNGSDIAEPKSWQQSYHCVWSNDIDRHACAVYRKNFGEAELYEGDCRSVDPGSLPSFDLLTGGFPCQPFSVAGRRKGTSDPRGTLFWEICRVLEAKRPKVVLLENVPGLLSIEGGNTFAQIILALGGLGYAVEWQVLDSQHFGVPQHRERVFIVGHLGGFPARTVFPVFGGDGEAPEGNGEGEQAVANCIDGNYWKGADNHGQRSLVQVATIGEDAQYSRVYDPAGVSKTITDGGGMGAKTGLYAVPVLTPDRLESGKDKRQQGPWMKKPGDPAHTLLGQGVNGVMVANCLDPDGYLRSGARPRDGNGNPQLLPIGYRRIRRLTPTECERLQGFPDGWTEGISDTQRYKCLGNAVTVNVIEFLGRRIREVLA